MPLRMQRLDIHIDFGFLPSSEWVAFICFSSQYPEEASRFYFKKYYYWTPRLKVPRGAINDFFSRMRWWTSFTGHRSKLTGERDLQGGAAGLDHDDWPYGGTEKGWDGRNFVLYILLLVTGTDHRVGTKNGGNVDDGWAYWGTKKGIGW